LHPGEARAAVLAGALLVDTRSQAQRAAQGSVPGALHVERNVLEWRFDPRSDARLPQAAGSNPATPTEKYQVRASIL